MIEIVNGSVLDAKETIIAHQVNCQAVMGSGVALSLRMKYPALLPHYKEYCDRTCINNSTKSLLGNVYLFFCRDGHIIANIFGQDNYGFNKVHTDMEALKKGLLILKEYALKNNYSIAMPYKIGCGRGGGDWSEVMNFISANFQDVNLTLYKWEEK